tara:strand:+ start:6715 stop:7269 length:555 start_codon:yes stop_codon:yes gene_type:complete
LDNIAQLICHPDTPSDAVREIIVSGDRGPAGFITLRYHLVGDVTRLHIPAPAKAGRADGLWSTTCFELFTRDEGDEAYREFNFSPSGQWAAYAFTGYREGMDEIDVWAPRISVAIEAEALTADVTFVSPRLGPQHVGACVVLEEKSGAKSFWALAHPPGKPDFHHPACFAYELSAADGHMTEHS